MTTTTAGRPTALVMAGLGGIETCRSLKADPTTAIIPVIIITAEVDRRSRLEAIAAGADDFLNKPYDRDEVLLRVRNAVRMKRLYDHVESDLWGMHVVGGEPGCGEPAQPGSHLPVVGPARHDEAGPAPPPRRGEAARRSCSIDRSAAVARRRNTACRSDSRRVRVPGARARALKGRR